MTNVMPKYTFEEITRLVKPGVKDCTGQLYYIVLFCLYLCVKNMNQGGKGVFQSVSLAKLISSFKMKCEGRC